MLYIRFKLLDFKPWFIFPINKVMIFPKEEMFYLLKTQSLFLISQFEGIKNLLKFRFFPVYWTFGFSVRSVLLQNKLLWCHQGILTLWCKNDVKKTQLYKSMCKHMVTQFYGCHKSCHRMTFPIIGSSLSVMIYRIHSSSKHLECVW